MHIDERSSVWVEILPKRTDDEAPKLRSTIYSIPVRINPVNDAPNLKPGIDPEALLISGESKLTLDSRAINLWDADSDPDTVFVSV
ncbi:unnamed protein product, partial [Gongylonema pulchrum]|uniref:Cadherin domain-containing protein n=1 Tax=Gongylonema pulchrum TaxID=637853 RepID=A0A183E2E4_9BILA